MEVFFESPTSSESCDNSAISFIPKHTVLVVKTFSRHTQHQYTKVSRYCDLYRDAKASTFCVIMYKACGFPSTAFSPSFRARLNSQNPSHHQVIREYTGQVVTSSDWSHRTLATRKAERPRASRLPETHTTTYNLGATGIERPANRYRESILSTARYRDGSLLSLRLILVSGVISGPSFRLLALQPDPWTNETTQPVEGVAVCCHLALIQQGGHHTGVVGR
jgi:hypothetical protein